MTSERFISPLDIGASDAVEVLSDRGMWASALVVFVRMHLSDYSASAEPYEVFAAALSGKLKDITGWLDRQSPDAFQQMRSGDLVTDLFLDAWIDGDQLDLTLPTSLLVACGRLGLSIGMITND